eukprot:8439850-Alexandrium_andersonii.AAC.1
MAALWEEVGENLALLVCSEYAERFAMIDTAVLRRAETTVEIGPVRDQGVVEAAGWLQPSVFERIAERQTLT